MKKSITSFIVFALITFLFTSSAFAHSGCCSYHDGVMSNGCGCNDGTPLSDTCAPYYTCNAPQQNTEPATNTYTPPVYVPPTATPTLTPTNTPTPTLTPTPTPKPVKKTIKKAVKKKVYKPKPTPTPQRNWWQRLFGI